MTQNSTPAASPFAAEKAQLEALNAKVDKLLGKTVPNSFIAADAQVTVGGSFHAVKIDFTDDNPSRVATVALMEGGGESLMRALAEALGFRVIAEDTAQELGALVRSTIADADNRNMAFADGNSSPTIKLHAHTDAMRDMRDALRQANVISG